MLRSKNVATPPTAATGVVPPSVPPPGLAPSATLTLPVNPGTRFPSRSEERRVGNGRICRPAMVVHGWMTNASWVAVPAVIENEVLVVDLDPDADVVGH